MKRNMSPQVEVPLLWSRLLPVIFATLLLTLGGATLLDGQETKGSTNPQTFTYRDLLTRLTDLERLATLPEPGERCAQVSSYDRRSRYDEKTGKYVDWGANVDGGGTEDIFEGDKMVVAHLEGPGCVWRMWSAGPKEGSFQLYLDGVEQPTLDMPFRQFFDGTAEHWPPLKNKAVPWPPSGNVSVPPFGPEPFGVRGWATGSALFHCVSRGWNSYIPMPFQKSFKVVADKWIPPYNHDGWGMFYQYTFERFLPGTRVPTMSVPFSEADQNALEKVNKSLANLGSDPAGHRTGQDTIRLTVKAIAGKSTTVVDLGGARAITGMHVKLDLPESPADRALLRKLILRITWDDDTKPSVWSPLGDFFGTTPGFNRYRSLPLGMTDEGFYSYWYMPFAKRGHVEIVNDDRTTNHAIQFSITHAPLTTPIEKLGRFHAKWHRDAFIDPARPVDWTMIKTRGRGRYVGTTLHIWQPEGGWWGEGDEKFFVDDEKFPSTFGTGTEDYFGYAWADPNLFSNAYHNQTHYAGRDGHSSLNRWHLGDSIPFQISFEGAMEKYFPNDRPTLYDCVAYWYLAPGGEDPYGPVPLHERLGEGTTMPVK